ncbi:MAG: PLDc N-terminal domain-containing protein [Ruminococcus sp.]|nr:PLDc N-terminal domain-containing protein [Ruminococcus sp.]
MITEFTKLFTYFTEMAADFPWWVTLVTIAIHLFFVIFCWKSGNPGTISRIFWICIIIMFPFAGILAYLLLSRLPASILSKRENSVQVRSMVKNGALLGIIVAGVIGLIVGNIYNKANDLTEDTILGLDFALLAWAITCVVDHFQSCKTENRFVRMGVYNDDGNFLVEPAGEIFGVKHYREIQVCSDNEKALEVQFVRRALVKSLLSVGAEGAVNDNYDGRDYCTSSYTDSELTFAGKPIDAIDVKYIGGGITKYTISVSETKGTGDDAEKVIVDRNLYRHRYNISGLIMRCVSLLAVVITLFSPLFVKCHGAITNVLEDLLSNFIK